MVTMTMTMTMIMITASVGAMAIMAITAIATYQEIDAAMRAVTPSDGKVRRKGLTQ
jgi:hypothetical protein